VSRPAARWALGLILLTSLAVNVFPLWWDLPSKEGWAYDALTPHDVREGARDLLEGRKRWRYPPLHYLLLNGVHRSIELTTGLVGVELSAPAARTTLQVAGRSVSVLMALLVVWLVYRSGRQLFDRGTSLLAAACVAFVCPFLYYAKTTNLEVPYLFWFALAIYFYLRALRRHRLGDYLLLATAVALSVCTKDQAFALYVLAPLPLTASLRNARRAEGLPAGVAATVFDRRIVGAALTVVVVFSAVHNLLFDWQGFLSHVEAMRDISGRSHEFANDLAGHAGLLAQNVRNTAFSLGLPLFLAACAGVVAALVRWRSRRYLVSLLVFPISYHLFFLAIARYSYDRFMLPVTLVLSFFAAPVLAWVARRAPVPRWVGVGAVAGLLVYTLLYAFSIDLEMHADSRAAARQWLEGRVGPGDGLLSVGRKRMVIQGHPHVPQGEFMNSGSRRLREDNPRFVVVQPEHLNEEIHRDLLMGRLNYRRVASVDREPVYSLLDFSGVRSNLQSVNPRVEIFERIGTWGAGPAEVRQEIAALLERPDPVRRSRLAGVLLRDPVPLKQQLTGPFLVAFGLHSLWTGRSPLAAVVAQNPSDEPIRPALRLTSRGGSSKRSPIVVVDDGEARTSHELRDLTTVRLELAPVAPGETRLYLLTLPEGDSVRPGGIEVTGPVLWPIGESGVRAGGVTPDGWMTGRPAVLTWENLSEEARRPPLGLECLASEADLPITVSVAGLHGRQRVVLESAGVHELTLWEVPAFHDEALILKTDRTREEPGGERRFGVRLLSSGPGGR
jgi:4-amino-4-deoxy-L-arabinose transferase-like glycosyltransferase